jgi:hypothetical protein
MRAFVLAGVALMMASGAQAGNGDELGCMQQSYTAAQSSQLDRILPQVDLLGSPESPVMDSLGTIVGEVVAGCVMNLAWTDREFEAAVLFEVGRLLETGMRRHGPLTKDEVTRVDTALARGDRSALWSAIEEQVAVGMSGGEEEISDADSVLMGAFMLEIGVGLDLNKAEQVGAFLATLAMQRASRREFIAVK